MKFETRVQPHAEKDAMGIIVPEEVVAALGAGRRPPVVVTVNGYTYRSTVFFMGGRFMLPLAKEHRLKAGLDDDQLVEVELTLDSAPRTVEAPADLAAALENANLRAAFDALAFTYRNEHVRAVEQAKAPETRARRIAKVLAALVEA